MSAEDKVRQKLQVGRKTTYLLSAAEIAKSQTSFPETINSMKLSENFKQLLHLNGTTAAKVSRSTGISKSVLSDWLAGVSPKKITDVKKLSDHFKISIDELVFGSTERKPAIGLLEQYKDEILAGEFEVVLRSIKKKP